MNERLEAIKSSILDSLDKAKTALNNKEVAVESLKVSEIPGYIRQIELNKIKLTVNCSEFGSGTIKATKDEKTRTGTVQDGQCIIMLPSTGTWHIEHDLGDYVETEVNGDTSAELVKKKVTFSEGECSEEKITIHVDSVTGNNSNDNFIRVKKNGVVIEVQAQLKGSDIEITNFEYEDGATYTIEYVIKDEVRGSIEVEIYVIPDNMAGSPDDIFEGVDGIEYNSNYNFYSGLPKHIVFTDQKAPQDAKVSYWTTNGSQGVARWLDSNTKTLYISSQSPGVKVVLPKNCKSLFPTKDLMSGNNGNSVLETIDFSNVDTSKVEDMSEMFYDCVSLTQLDLSNFDTSNVKTFNSMFAHCERVETLDLSSFNIDKVTDMFSIFRWDDKLTTIYANEWANSHNNELNGFALFSDRSSNLPNFNSSKTDLSMAKWKENGGYFTNPAEKPN